jgi:rare lipoprotein A
MSRGWRGESHLGGRARLAFVSGAATLLLAGCSVPQLSTWHPPNAKPERYVETGTASWYGPGFHGNRTSSGEVFTSADMTAAHQTLPIGTRVEVTNLENGRSVEVRINDRGPFAKGRIIDLSHAAADALGLVGPGTAQVRIESVDDGNGPPGTVLYAVQAGAFADGVAARRLSADLSGRYTGVYLNQLRTDDALYYRVRVGPFDRRDDAVARAREIAHSGLPAVIVEEVRR